MKAGKAWGVTTKITSNKAFEMHRIHAEKGGKCSRHRHRTKYNGFLVLKGCLAIRVWKEDQDLVDCTILCPGEYTEITPPEWHQFEALEDTDAIEIYWGEFNAADIERDIQ